MPRKKLERKFQSEIEKKLEEKYGEYCIIQRNDPKSRQGIPDDLIFCAFPNHELYWTFIEFKRDPTSPHQPNQDYYTNMNGHFINPENAEEVLDEIDKEIKWAIRQKVRRNPRTPKSE